MVERIMNMIYLEKQFLAKISGYGDLFGWQEGFITEISMTRCRNGTENDDVV